MPDDLSGTRGLSPSSVAIRSEALDGWEHRTLAKTGSTSILSDLQAMVARGALWALMQLPYERRVRLAGRVFSSVLAPLTGWRRRIRRNVEIAWPDLSAAEKAELVQKVPDSVGRMLIECWSGQAFVERVVDTPFEGPGLAPFEAARAEGRPVILITAHFGNYDAMRATLVRRGHDLGGLYKPMKNAGFNEVYLKVISEIGERVYPTTGRGITGLLRYLESGGLIGIVVDVASKKAPLLTYFDQPAHTPLSAAEWALKYDALLIPVFCIRQEDGLSFRMEFKAPIEHRAPADMMQDMNDITEEMVRRYPTQWFWVHNRWKRSKKAS